jgi:SulP family sulfate permease
LKFTVAGDVNLHKEVFAQGVANTLSPFFSTFAGSGSFNRTSVAVEMRALTPLAGMVAAVGVALIAWALAPLLTWLPMPAIAGILVLVGIGMIQGNNFRLLRSRIEGSVFLVTLASVVLLGLEIGIFVAVAASVLCFVLGAAKVNFAVVREGQIECIAVKGNLFYASLDLLTKHLRSSPSAHTVVDLSAVAYCDASARNMIRKIQEERSRRGGRLDVKPPV